MQVSRRCGSDNLQVRQASDFSTQGVAEWLSLPAHRELGERVHPLFLFLPYPNFYIFHLYKLAAKWSKTGESSRSLYIYIESYRYDI